MFAVSNQLLFALIAVPLGLAFLLVIIALCCIARRARRNKLADL